MSLNNLKIVIPIQPLIDQKAPTIASKSKVELSLNCPGALEKQVFFFPMLLELSIIFAERLSKDLFISELH